MSDLAGHGRTPRLLWPDLLDDDVTEEPAGRFIDADVESLDRERLGVARAQTARLEDLPMIQGIGSGAPSMETSTGSGPAADWSGTLIATWSFSGFCEHSDPAIMQERKPLVAHPFSTIKHANAQGYVLVKGRKNVRAAFSLSCWADHRKRLINILGVPQRLEALG